LQQLYCHQVTNPNQVLNIIDIPPPRDADQGAEEGGANDHHQILAMHLKQHLACYLHGSGHPDHPLYNDLISAEKRKEAQKDPTFHACQFLPLMSGTTFLDSPPHKMEASQSFHLQIQPPLICL
jgi:hypothetical protein